MTTALRMTALRRLTLLALLAGGPALAQDHPRAGVEETTDRPEAVAPAAGPLKINARDLKGYGGHFTVSGTTGGASVEWSLSPHPAGMFFHPFPGAHAVSLGGPPGTYTLTAQVTVFRGRILKLPKGWKEGDEVPLEITPDVQRVSLVVELTGGAPVPPGPGPTPPGPTPPVPPGPTPPSPDPNPMPGVTGLHMLVVYESGDVSKYPAAQVNSWQSQAVFDYLKAKNALANWRVWDRDVPNLNRAEPKWQAAMARARGKQLPWVIVSNGTTGYEGPAPADTAGLLALLKKYGGD